MRERHPQASCSASTSQTVHRASGARGGRTESVYKHGSLCTLDLHPSGS